MPADSGRAVSSRELRARYKVALRTLAERTKRPGRAGADAIRLAEDEVEILKGQIDDEREMIANGIEILKIRLRRMEAELAALNSHLSLNKKMLARHQEMLRTNAITPSVVEQTESDVSSSETQVMLKEIDILEVKTRIEQLNRSLKLFDSAGAGNASPAPKETPASQPPHP